MASIYDQNGDTITEGLQGCNVSDEAIQMAQRIANERGENVTLVDDDGEWEVAPDSDDDAPAATTAQTVTAYYRDGQTWVRTDDGERFELTHEIEVAGGDIERFSEPDGDWKVATFADGSQIVMTESWWDVLDADGRDSGGNRCWTEAAGDDDETAGDDETAAHIETLATAVEAAIVEFDGIGWDNHMDAIASVLEAAKPARLRKLVNDAIDGALETGSEFSNDGTAESQSHRREIAECVEALSTLDLDDAAAVAELASRFRSIADAEAAYVTSRSDAAADLGREAVEAAKAGDHDKALDLAKRAYEIEMEFGDAPAWRPVYAAAEALVESAEADGDYHWSPANADSDGQDTSGSLDDAMAYAAAWDVTLTLRSANGESRGWVKPGGDYNLQ